VPRVFRVAATDKGVLGLVRSVVDERGCAWNSAPDESCSGFFFAPWKDGAGSPARFPVGAVGDFSPVKTSRSWSWIWPGKQGAYALLSQDKKQTLGVLDGQTEQTFEVEGATIEQIVETAQGPVALWVAGNVMSAPLTLQDGKATLGKPTRHRVATARTAQDARELLGRGQAPAVEWAAIPNMNDSGELDSAFLLTWSEAIPPEKGSDRVSARERRIVARRNLMCGFSASRSVADPSVIKRIMVQRTRRDGVAEGIAREIARGDADKPAPLLRLESRPKVRERLVGEAEQVDPPAGLKAPPEQEIVAAGYDVEQKQGVVVLAQAGELAAQVIDELGKPVGAPFKAGPVRPVERRATFFHDGWLIPANKGRSLVVLTGPRAGTEIKTSVSEPSLREWPMTGARVAVVKGVARVLAKVEDDPGGIEAHSVPLSAILKKDAKSLVYSPSTGLGPGDAAQVLDNGTIALFERYVRDPGDPPLSNRYNAWRAVFPGKPDAEPTSWESEGDPQIIDVFGDHALVMRPRTIETGPARLLSAVWLRSGKTVELEGTEKKSPADFVLLEGGLMALPGQPGQAFSIKPLASPPRRCVDELAVGPKTRLWLCYKPWGPGGWSHTAGVQVLRY